MINHKKDVLSVVKLAIFQLIAAMITVVKDVVTKDIFQESVLIQMKKQYKKKFLLNIAGKLT